jgi:hypothetical protein
VAAAAAAAAAAGANNDSGMLDVDMDGGMVGADVNNQDADNAQPEMPPCPTVSDAFSAEKVNRGGTGYENEMLHIGLAANTTPALSTSDISNELLLHLVTLILVNVHPVFPLFHIPSFLPRVYSRQIEEPLFLALCGVGCIFSSHPALFSPPFMCPKVSSEKMMRRAENMIFQARGLSESLEMLQALALLCVYDFGMANARGAYVSLQLLSFHLTCHRPFSF